jgi:ribonuclease H2 subunit A
MIYGAAYWPEAENEALGKMGYDDSKALTHARRSALFESLKRCGRIGYCIISLSAQYLSEQMLHKSPNSLNKVSHETAVQLVHEAQNAGVNVTSIYVDTVGDADRYRDKLQYILGPSIRVTVESKADATYPVVSAASICAKVTRDAAMEEWEFEEPGFESTGPLGSGYPGDAVTKAWMENNQDTVFGFPSLVRFSWATTKKLMQEKGCKADWGDDEEEDVGAPKITGFFQAKSGPPKRPAWYHTRGMSHVMDIE